MMRAFAASSHLFGANAPFIEDLYERYLDDPAAVPGAWRAYFDSLQDGGAVRDVPHQPVRARFAELARGTRAPIAAPPSALTQIERKQTSVLQLINAYRFLGVDVADLDPLTRHESPQIPELTLSHYGLGDMDLDAVFSTGSLVGPAQARLRDILDTLKATYTGHVGAEYMYMRSVEQKRWVQNRLEGTRATATFDAALRRRVLERLTWAETLEKYLHTRYVGQKRFSLEGGESLIPLLDQLIVHAAEAGVEETVIGMAHRGRLNVLVNLLGRRPQDLFLEFEGNGADELLSGDVKYHLGFSAHLAAPGPNGSIHVVVAFNPSHLEIVNPVVEGSVRARQQRRQDKQGRRVLPVQIHGDASFAGQGVVMETLNMSQTRGFGTGGTVHVVVNNQIGFTTSDPRDTRSSLYATDVAKVVEAPIFHVNGDDPEAVVFVTQLALDFRMTFGRDVVIDLVCFRRWGHNEQDEPLVTQPLMYKKINRHPGVRELYARRLAGDGVIGAQTVDTMISEYRALLDRGEPVVRQAALAGARPFATDWSTVRHGDLRASVDTGVPRERLAALATRLTTVPPNFKLHPRVEKVIADRRSMGEGTLPLDWGMAETLAYATLLADGYGVRISGQDSARGTFFHRHAVLHDQNRERWDGGEYVPLQHLAPDQPNFLVIDSILSEEAVLGFEYGYATAEPNELVVWEAQFGDFANGAQVVIDTFISAGEAKWGRMCGLVMLLPHGHEGQGPEHTSARLERFLQLCADDNMQVCVPSLPSQIFHLLRRQMRRPVRKPLVVMTPKSLLRHKLATSTLDDLARGEYRTVIGEGEGLDASAVTRVLACAGKVYYDLAQARRERALTDVAIVRVEQLYPFPLAALKQELARYPNARELVWVQEEPKNQGAWFQIQHHLRECLREGLTLSYAGRPFSASPAVGYLKKHMAQQTALVEQALAR